MWAAKQEKFRPLQECFFLTFPFIDQALEPNGGRFCLVCLEAASIGNSLIGGGTNVARHLAGIFRVGFRKRLGLRG
jgi:hypothetical protein